jgi:protein-disulfide isomerase
MNDQEPTDLPEARAHDAPPEAGPPEAGPPEAPPPPEALPETGSPEASPPEGAGLDGEAAGGESLEPAEPPAATAPQRTAAAPSRAPRVLGYLAAAAGGGLLVGLVLFAAGALGAGSPTPSPSPAPSATPAASASPTSPAGSVFVDGQAVGRADAPVTITIWADYQCPFCRLEAFAFGGALEREYAGSGLARIVFHDLAILDYGSSTKESQDAAIAARCAGRQDPGGYWRYHDLLFLQQQGENQGAFARENLVALAGISGLDTPSFTACLDDPAVREAVVAQTAEGNAQGVQSTPTTIVTGPGPTQILRGFTQEWTVLADAIERAASPGATPTPGPTPISTPAASPTGSAGESPSASPGPSAGAAASPSP